MVNTQLNIYLKKCREKSGMSQGILSDKLGYTNPQYISRIETGKCNASARVLAYYVKHCSANTRKIADFAGFHLRNQIIDAIAKLPKTKK